MWDIKFTKNAEKEKKLLKRVVLEETTKKLLDILCENPYQNPPQFEKLVGDLKDYYSRRINIQHRLVYRIIDNKKIIIIHSIWSHYE